MELLNNENMLSVNGGALSAGAWLGIGAGIVFLIGVIDGFLRPYKCRS